MVEGADHDGVDVAGEDAARVRRGLALAHLYLLGGEGEGVPAELVHPDLERDAGAVGWLLEDHRERPAAQGAVGDAALLHGFDLDGLVQDQGHFVRREFRQRQAVPTREGGRFRRNVVYLRDHGQNDLRHRCFGDGNNVAHSLAIACALTGAELTIAHPDGYGPDEKVLEAAGRLGAIPTITDDPREAASGARVVYTDVWASMGQEAEAEGRKKEFGPFQVNEELMGLAAGDAIFLHCLPAHRGEEVTAGVIDGPQSRVFDQAENRLHAQKALLYLLMG